jgi:predicted transcriptional regulator
MVNPRSIKLLAFVLVIIVFFIPSVTAGESSIVGEVMEAGTQNPISGATIRVYLSGSEDLVAETTSEPDGYFQVTGLSDGDYTVKIIAQGYINQSHEVTVDSGALGGETTVLLDVQLNPRLGGGEEDPKEEEGAAFPMSLFAQIFMIVAIALIISIVMYSKIKKENLLKNAQRKRIMDYITDNPGIHYRAILSGLDLPMGSLSYHLNRLEKGQYIKSRQDGMYRRFYVKSTRTEMKFFLSDIQESILQVIKENQGISQSKIANKINVSRKVVNYHVNILDRAGLIFVESRGRESACFISEAKSVKVAEGS